MDIEQAHYCPGMTLANNLTLMISVLKNQLAFSKQITPCLDLSGGSTTQNQHGLSSRAAVSTMIATPAKIQTGISYFDTNKQFYL